MVDIIGYDRLRRAVGQFWKYCLVGVTGFIVNLTVFWLMINMFDAHYLVAGTVSFGIAVTNNFLLNRHWTFESSERDLFSQAGRILIRDPEDPTLNPYVAQAFAICMVTILNFTGNKLWSFRQPTA